MKPSIPFLALHRICKKVGDMIIETDMDCFKWKPEGIQIHSGNTDAKYDHQKLMQGKYLPWSILHNAKIIESDYTNHIFTWTVE